MWDARRWRCRIISSSLFFSLSLVSFESLQIAEVFYELRFDSQMSHKRSFFVVEWLNGRFGCNREECVHFMLNLRWSRQEKSAHSHTHTARICWIIKNLIVILNVLAEVVKTVKSIERTLISFFSFQLFIHKGSLKFDDAYGVRMCYRSTQITAKMSQWIFKFHTKFYKIKSNIYELS